MPHELTPRGADASTEAYGSGPEAKARRLARLAQLGEDELIAEIGMAQAAEIKADDFIGELELAKDRAEVTLRDCQERLQEAQQALRNFLKRGRGR